MHIVILGNGIAGITAARHLRKRTDHEITIVSDETPHFFSRTALMYVFMGHQKMEHTKPYEDWFWGKNRLQLVHDYVKAVDFHQKKLHLTAGNSLSYDRLIIATGSKSNKIGCAGEDLQGVQGLYFKQDLEKMEAAARRGVRRAVVVGGGLIGVEMAEMWHSRHVPVTFLVRENEFWHSVLPFEEAQMISRHLLEHGIDLRLATELDSILPDENGHAAAVVLKNGEKIDCQFVGLTVGVSPNVDFLKNSGLEINRGILVNEFLETNQPNVFAIGDCAELRNPPVGRRAIEAVWYTGRMMGETVAHSITDCGMRIAEFSNSGGEQGNSEFRIPNSEFVYAPGVWFNSAKFFDIEYQVYGHVPPQMPSSLDSIFWKHLDEKHSIRLVFENKTGKIVGFNLLGVRYRHEVCERWLTDGAHIETVLENLGLANFDPEFFEEYEVELVKIYNRQSQKNLTLKTRRGLPAVLRFLKKQLA